MIRQYYAQRRQGGNNPLGVGTIAGGSIHYLQDEGYFGARHGEAPVCRNPWIVEAFLNGPCHAARRDPRTGKWTSTHVSGRSDTAMVRSLRDGRRRIVAVRTLQLHEELGLSKGLQRYPSKPDLRFYRCGSREAAPQEAGIPHDSQTSPRPSARATRRAA